MTRGRIQERANELIRDLLENLDEDAGSVAEAMLSAMVDARAKEILIERSGDVERLANQRAIEKIDELADKLALEIVQKKAREFARARAEAIIKRIERADRSFYGCFSKRLRDQGVLRKTRGRNRLDCE